MQAVLCTWDGDVWQVDGIDGKSGTLTWRRIASGLFQPLGIKVVDGQIYVSCRDQIAILHDLNGDGETDFYESFNSDHQVTEHFHEFAMGLQTDAAGNFYYAKAARHGSHRAGPAPWHAAARQPRRKPHRHPRHRLSRTQRRLREPRRHVLPHRPGRILAAQEPDQLGETRQLSRQHVGISRCDRPFRLRDGAAGLLDHQQLSTARRVRSSGSTETAGGRSRAACSTCRTGTARSSSCCTRKSDEKMQGGLATLPIPQFPTGIMRGRFHPGDGQLYTCGMYAWAGNQTQPGGFYRVRYTGKPIYVPVGLSARRDGMAITFTGALDPSTATDVEPLLGADLGAEANRELRLGPHQRAIFAGAIGDAIG